IRSTTKTDLATAPLVLVAEDEDSNFELVKIVLSKQYRLLRARNGIEAVTYCEDEHPDLILMDIRMPDMNGLDATRIIKEVNHDIPVIALSAYAFDENIREAKAAGCDEFMAKPFRVEDLIDMVEKYVKH
ncbi:MAG: response regulator, partial [Prevotella sp.]|nr:response regulator [Prevotella sp.]